MATKKSYQLNSQSKKRIFALAVIMMCIALSAFFAATVSSAIGMGAEASTDVGSGHTDAVVSAFAESVETGASVTIKATDELTRETGLDSTAEVNVTEVATVTFDKGFVKAFESGRLTAELYVSGSNALTVTSGKKSVATVNYVVDGALVGSGSLSDKTTFENLKLTTNKGSSFETLTFAYTVNLKAEDRASGMSGTHAAVSVDCNVNLILKLKFEEGNVTIVLQTGGAIYKGEKLLADEYSTTTHSVAFGEALDFRAEPKNGYYFVGWKFSDRDVRSNSKISSFGTSDDPIEYGYDIPMENLTVTAVFQPLTLQNGGSEFSYNTLAQGPAIATSFELNYIVVNLYSGTVNGMPVTTVDGEGNQQTTIQEDYVIANETQKPKYAGKYTHVGYIFYKDCPEAERVEANAVGKTINEYEITRNEPTFVRDDDRTEQTIRYGGTLEEVVLTGKAYNSEKITVKLTSAGTVSIWGPVKNDQNEVTGYAEVTDLTKLLVPGADDYYIRFTPDDVYNYTYVELLLHITVEDTITGRAYNADDSTRTYSVEKSIVTEVDGTVPNNLGSTTLTHEVIKVSLRATMTDTSGRYFFIGWRINLPDTGYSYLTAGSAGEEGYSGLEYDYYIPRVGDVKSEVDKTYTKEDIDAYANAEFIALFVLDTSTPAGTNDLDVTYTGGGRSLLPSFSPENAGHGFGYTDVEYYDQNGDRLSGAPSAIGNYTIKYTVRNTELNVEVGERVINYRIVAGVVQAELNENRSVGEGNYNASTGWAKKKFYTLSVKGLLAGAVDKYYYKTANGDWTLIEGTISSGSGCRITFATPDVTETSTVDVYSFKAVDANGIVVAETYGEGVECKIDGTTPYIYSLVTEYRNEWTKNEVVYNMSVSYGGSGAVIDIMYVNESSGWVKLDSELSFLTGSSVEYVTKDITFSVNKEYTGSVKFRIRNGVGDTVEDGSNFVVNIDKSSPVLGFGENSENVNANGWIGVATDITFSVTDAGGSGIKEVTADNAEVTKKSEGVYSITVTDSARYVVRVWDNAGNYSDTEYFASVDTEDVTYSLSNDSITGGSWVNGEAVISFDVTVGASGARLMYSTDDGATYRVCDAELGFYSGETTSVGLRTVRLEYAIDLEDGEYEYRFRIENGAGIQKEYDFGFIGFDSVSPEFGDITDISAYQGVAWTSNVIYVEFKVTDASAPVSSGIESVTSDNGGEPIYDATSGKYTLAIDKCTPFTVVATDKAGNSAEYVFKANVDTIEPTLDISAYVGGGDPGDVNVVPSGDYKEYDFASWITASEPEPWIRLEFTINLTASGSALEISEDDGATWRAITETYRPEGNAVTGTVSTRTYITQEQNKSYKFRLSTGSGRKVAFDPVTDGKAYVRIDFTAPVLRSSTYISGYDLNFPAETQWTSNKAVWRILPGDTSGGSGVNYDTIALYEFGIDTPDEEVVLSNIDGAIKRTMELSGSYFVYEFTEYNKYLLAFEDNAGNIYAGKPFSPKVDLTSDFELELGAVIRTEGGTGSYDYTGDKWLANDGYVEFTGVPKFNGEYKAFGPSGAQMQFSVDGGESWSDNVTVGGVTSTVVYDENSGNYIFATSGDQVLTYKFRLITGAGACYACEGEYSVKRDGVAPIVTAFANADGEEGEYDGEWTKSHVAIVVTVEHGVSGGVLEVRLGENGEWQEIASANINTVATGDNADKHTYTIDYSYNGNVYFRYVSRKVENGTPVSAETSGTQIKLDNAEVVASIEVAGANGVSVENGEWSYGELTIKANVTTGASGIRAVYVSYASDGVFGDYELVNPTDGEYKVKFSAESADGSAYRSYKFKAISVSGKESETDTYSVGTDNAVITLAPEYAGTKVSNYAGVFTDWYLTTVSIALNPDEENASGYKTYYTYQESDGNGGWVSSGVWTEVDSHFAIGYKEDDTPDDRVGGLDRRYGFKTVTGAGKELVYTNEGDEWVYLPIDLHTYYLHFESRVGDIVIPSSVECATIRGAGETYRRGDLVNIGYTPTGTYRFKSASITGLTVPSDQSFNSLSVGVQTKADNDYAIVSVNVYIGGGDVDFKIQLYKEVKLGYSLNKQYLQNGAISHVGVVATETGFTELFGNPGFGSTGTPKLVAEYYGDGYLEETPAQAIGEYTVTVSVSEEFSADYFVSSDSKQTSLTVVYFTGNGTSADPYPVKSQADFEYLDIYGSAGDYDYLGENRATGYFRQTADIYVDAKFKPMGAEGDGFKGVYDGNGYRVIGEQTFDVKDGDFGLFRTISGASINNLGVEFDVKGSGVGTLGLITAFAKDSGIRSCYVVGDIEVKGNGICVGGIVGEANSTLVSVSFADVRIEVDRSYGYVGGIIGRAIKCFTSDSFTVSAITVTDSEKYDSVAEAGTKFLYAGAIVGSVEMFGEVASTPQTNSYYLDKNISYDGSIETGLSVGNAHSLSNYNALRHVGTGIDAFASESFTYGGKNTATTLIQNVTERGYTLTVKDLTYMRIEREKEGNDVDGNGTSDDPFIVDEVSKLGLIEIFPWAYFMQTADIEVGVTSGYAHTVPFIGVYDGNGHSLKNVIISAEHTDSTVCYGGLFGVNGGTIKNLTVLDVDYDYSVNGTIYAGGLVGYAKEGSVIENVVITGSLKVKGGDSAVFAGGVVGLGYDAKIISVITLVGVEVDSDYAVTGGVVGLIKGASATDDVVAISSVSVISEKRADTGTVIGAVAGTSSSVTNVGYLVSSCYVGGKVLESAVGVNGGISVGARAYSYNDLAGVGANVTVNGKSVYETIIGLYPFEGRGTEADPFEVSTYKDLLQIGNYMYACFVLTEDIWIGDYDADGAIDEDYDYGYSPIGNGAAFTGQLNGKGHTIFGLTDSLFAINAGTVSGLTLNVSYKVYANEEDVQDADKFIDAEGNTVLKAKVATPGEDVLFGAVARVNRDTGSITRVGVTGEIYVRVSGKAKATIGGVVGADFGGSIAGCNMSAEMYVRASYADVGGVVGVVSGSAEVLEMIETNTVIVDEIDVGGSTIHAGVYVGAVKVTHEYAPAYAADTNIVVNGTDIGTVYVGYEK